MSISRKTAVGFSCLAVATLSCGVIVDVNEDNFCEEYAEVACHNMFRCCSGATIEYTLGTQHTQDEEDCRRDLDLGCQDRYSATFASIDAGRIKVETDRANACLESMLVPDEGCFVYTSETTLNDNCHQQFFVGQQAAGEDCVINDDCVEYHRCNDELKCEAISASTDCRFVGCQYGYYCDPDGACQEKKTDGSDCTGNVQCKSGDCEEVCIPVYREIDYCQVIFQFAD